MTLHWPQLTVIVLIALDLGCSLALHGKPRGLHNVWMKLLDIAIFGWLLHAGGFFGVVT